MQQCYLILINNFHPLSHTSPLLLPCFQAFLRLAHTTHYTAFPPTSRTESHDLTAACLPHAASESCTLDFTIIIMSVLYLSISTSLSLSCWGHYNHRSSYIQLHSFHDHTAYTLWQWCKRPTTVLSKTTSLATEKQIIMHTLVDQSLRVREMLQCLGKAHTAGASALLPLRDLTA